MGQQWQASEKHLNEGVIIKGEALESPSLSYSLSCSCCGVFLFVCSVLLSCSSTILRRKCPHYIHKSCLSGPRGPCIGTPRGSSLASSWLLRVEHPCRSVSPTCMNAVSGKATVVRTAAEVPYRDGKLTRLLADSLGGQTRTTLCCRRVPGNSA